MSATVQAAPAAATTEPPEPIGLERRYELARAALGRLTRAAEALVNIDPATPVPTRLEALADVDRNLALANRVLRLTRQGGPV